VDKKLNLLTNPTFEKGLDGWSAHANKGKGVVTVDKAELKDGKPTLRIENLGGDDTMVSQMVKVKPLTRYRLSAMVKTRDVVPVDKTGNNGACLMIKGGFEKSEAMQKTKSWRTVIFEFDTGPKTELEVGPRLGFFGGLVTGNAWFAELSMTEQGPAKR
jgi:carbohydrate binding protein with CBM4/9 domain